MELTAAAIRRYVATRLAAHIADIHAFPGPHPEWDAGYLDGYGTALTDLTEWIRETLGEVLPPLVDREADGLDIAID
ncbi:hypothetical protein [Herpetosiphon geysericola]|uniref:Uncharacterized protein n=1 Tax=Herpetosiphon geysericola TaxID=70996 RepID=A0A0P6XUM2_9CHLR|nr:hypothetical protein [Herpetosiphon geysericola]KPL80262.1 hypothetical protein SE18_24735 [Herpetosiphon geysericola]